MTSSFKNTARQALIVACAALLFTGVGYVFAAPTALPPNNSIPLPLNVGSTAQTKAGALTVQGALSATGGLSVTGTTTLGTTNVSTLNVSQICLAGDCKSTWPSGGSSTATTTDTGAYHSSFQCYVYNYYNQLSFYYSGSQYTQQTYHCGDIGFSMVVPSNIASGKTITATLSGTVWCHSGPYNYNGYMPAASYITDSYYYNRIAGTVTSVTNNNNGTVTVNGTCKFVGYNTNSYAYIGMRTQGLTFLTN